MKDGEVAGLWEGKVVDNKDPDGNRRLKVRVPQIHGTVQDIPDTQLPWAWPCFPYGGPSYGDDFAPGVGADVWVMFRHGDPQSPVWVGVWYGAGKGPKDKAATGPAKSEPKGNYRQTEGGWFIGFNEKDPKSQFEIRAPNDEYVFKMDPVGKEMSLETQQGVGFKIDLTTSKVQISGIGALPLAGCVTGNHVCAYTGAKHPQSSLEVEATG